MRIARIDGPAGPVFAVQGGDESWVDVGSFGIEVATTPELVKAADDLAALDLATVGGGVVDPQFLAPIVGPRKMMAIGLNYADHIRETGSKPPSNPILFSKYSTSVVGPTDDIVVDPELTKMADYETELALIIGRRTKGISEADAPSAVFGYTVANDVTARDCMKTDGQLDRSKNFDTFCPVGPWITTADAVPEPQALGIRTLVNGEVRQDSSTREMLFPVVHLIHFLARAMTLEPGDVLLTGTPHGVGFVMDPPRFLQAGDLVECEVEGLGKLRNRVVGPAA
ncbi:MAG TPA: fumarylacetoacetate hydrolase family protein [Acidimicrobiia bacterium]|nr:fumarylacetoacetate hydrolase family protein [Acidimicrobiia bacterium]